MRRMLRSAFLKSLLVIALLFAQQGVVTHVISHVLEESQDQSLPHDRHCDICEMYAQIGSAIGSSSIQFDFASTFQEILATHFVSYRSIAVAPFAARAPPRLA